MASILLKTRRERALLRHHPWIYSGAVDKVQGDPQQGETVDVYSASGELLARGAYSPYSQIRVRIWTWEPGEKINSEFFQNRLTKAISRRRVWVAPEETNAMRLVHGESDSLPGLIVDQYDDTLVLQCLSSGIEHWREIIADLLIDVTGVESVYERSDVPVREREGLTSRIGLLRGKEPPELIEIFENGLRFWVDVRGGHKTGFYLDQRSNRSRVQVLVQGCQVLDCFSYTGGFTIASIAGGAKSVLSVDSSAEVLSLAKKNLALNKLSPELVEWRAGDVFQILRELRDRDRKFDIIVLDPPRFAATTSQVERAARGYKDVNLLALKLLKPGGKLVTFSCSGGVSAELFQKILAGAALDAGVEAQIVQQLRQGPDHPVSLYFPEGEYLKGFIIQV